jgi:uncharacterized Zn-finger protein
MKMRDKDDLVGNSVTCPFCDENTPMKMGRDSKIECEHCKRKFDANNVEREVIFL